MKYLLFGAGILYLMIGVFFAELLHTPGDDFSNILILFWPVAIILLIIFVLVAIPSKLAEWVKESFKEKLQ